MDSTAPWAERSPLGRLYDLDARILLLGVGHESSTSLHLAEHRATWRSKRRTAFGSPVMIEGHATLAGGPGSRCRRQRLPRLGAAFERDTQHVAIGCVAGATARLIPM
jgi:aminoglycoside 3-N-acetyltransferase